MAIRYSVGTKTVSWLYNETKKGNIKTDVAFQREEVWDKLRKSNLIVSLLSGIPIPNLLLEETSKDGEESTAYIPIEGKQRIASIKQFIDGEFALHKRIEIVEPYNDIAGKTFNDLTGEQRELINQVNLPITFFRPMSEKERAIVFFMTNQASPLTSMEISRSGIGEVGLEKLKKIREHEFLTEKLSITKKARLRFIDTQVIIEYVMLSNNENRDFTSTGIADYCKILAENPGLINVDKTIAVLDYMNKAISEKYSYMNKANTPLLMLICEKLIEKEIPPEKFGEWVTGEGKYFQKKIRSEEYLLRRSYKRKDVQERLRILMAGANKI